MSRLLLRLDGVGKRYPLTVDSGQRLRSFWQLLVRGRSAGGKSVLEDIGLEVRAGESVGIIGANGAGKSTLLKIITGVLSPSAGRLEQHGTRAALLELGAGFEPEYSGMDNLRINAAFLGLKPDQVNRKLDDILAFADIGTAIDEPIKHYSSGMVVRLGFAVVAAARPDLLITDEVLAVGDESFQKKCIRWIEQYLADGGTLLMVSHNMYQVQKLCRQALWLDAGRARAQGDVFDVTQAYLAWHERRDAAARAQREQARKDRDHAMHYQVRDLQLNGTGPETEPRLEPRATLRVRLELKSSENRAPVALVGVVRADGTPVYGVATDHDGVLPKPGPDRSYIVELEFPRLALLPGGYALRAHALDPEGMRVHDTVERNFTVTGRSRALGLVELEHRWITGSRDTTGTPGGK